MAIRDVVKIDEEKCNGCGQCASACVEGAIEIINGKAKLVSDIYCDGLGACIGECPQDAITVEKREAEDFSEEAVKTRHAGDTPDVETPGICSGTAIQEIDRCELVDLKGKVEDSIFEPSRLGNWPVQLKLVPVEAPYLINADLLIAADCVPFAFADFHKRFLPGKTLLIGCPKLDSSEFYREKLAKIIASNNIKSIEIAYMEVPCCFGLVHLVHESIKETGKEIPLTLTKVGIKGDVLEIVKVDNGGEQIG